MKLYPFNVMKFVKIQPTLLEIQLHPLKYGKGRGSKENARYSYMNQLIAEQANKTKCLVFSNKFYTKWQDYGMNKLDYRLFHSRNKGEEWVECILNENRPETNITLATNYLGIGVEIKNEEEVHIYFDLNEGWDMDFIIQSLGRPRDAKTIVLHFFYTEKDTGIRSNLDDEDLKTILSTAFDYLVTENRESGEPILNLLAARMTKVFDSLYNQHKNNDKIESLIISRILNGYRNMSIWDLDLLVKRLKFESVIVHQNNVVELLSTGKRIKVEETALCDMLCSRTDEWWERNVNRTNESVLWDPDLIYNDKVRAGKLLTMCRKIWWNGFNLRDTREYFGSISTAEKVIGYLNRYCQVKSGQISMEYFEGSEKSKEEIEKEFSIVEKVFHKEYLDYRIDRECARIPMRNIPLIPYDFNDIFKEVWDLSESNDIVENNDIPSPFVGQTYNGRLSEKKTEMSLINGKIGGKKSSPRKNISIQRISTGEVMEFPSKTDCMKFLKISSATFSKFIKEGGTKKTLDWVPVQVGGETVRYAS